MNTSLTDTKVDAAAAEAARVKTLRDYEVLDTPPEESFDRLTRTAAYLFDTPIALVSLIDEDRQWFKSRYGLETMYTAREMAFCDYTIQSDEVLIVPDATQDPRFENNPLVTGAPFIRFYIGAPLIARDGRRLGSLCVIDTKTRNLPVPSQVARLQDLAAAVIDVMELRQAVLREKFADAQRDVDRQQQFYRKTPAMLHSINQGSRIIEVSDYWCEKLGYRRSDVIGRLFTDFLTEESRTFAIETELPEFFRTGITNSAPFQIVCKNGSVRDVLLCARAIRNAEGDITQSLAIMVDAPKKT